MKTDFNAVVGPVKPVNGVGQPPMIDALGSWSMMHYLGEAGIPYSRLHDVGGWLGGGLYVDIPNLFRDFGADENDPANYVFAYTDSLVSALVAQGVEPFFRLGVTIENFAENGFPPVNTLPPSDPAKWARVCEHVMRHFTEGWAGGFGFKVTYWEIWNEPENNPDPSKNPMWRGDWNSYCDFYGVVAPYLKSRFPHLKIGGYGHCGFYAGTDSKRVAAANSSPRMEYFIECGETFLERARAGNWPLDFFSYHTYSDPEDALSQVEYADRFLSSHGFSRDRTERILNEWLPEPWLGKLGSARQAAEIASVMIGLQNGPCDAACIYDARCGSSAYSPLFNPFTRMPHKAYYVFAAFNELRKLGSAVRCGETPRGVYAAAAADATGRAAMLVANISGSAFALPDVFSGRRPVRARIIDAPRDWNEIPVPAALATDSVLLLEFR